MVVGVEVGRGMEAARCKGMVDLVGGGNRGRRGRGMLLPPPAAASEARGPPSTGALVLTDQVTSERGTPVDGVTAAAGAAADTVAGAAVRGGGAGEGRPNESTSRKGSLSRDSAMMLRIICRDPLSLLTKVIKAVSIKVREATGAVDLRIFRNLESTVVGTLNTT